MLFEAMWFSGTYGSIVYLVSNNSLIMAHSMSFGVNITIWESSPITSQTVFFEKSCLLKGLDMI